VNGWIINPRDWVVTMAMVERPGRVTREIDSGHPITVSGEGKSYELPAIKVRGWKERFRKVC
jgi:hypothetical protein